MCLPVAEAGLAGLEERVSAHHFHLGGNLSAHVALVPAGLPACLSDVCVAPSGAARRLAPSSSSPPAALSGATIFNGDKTNAVPRSGARRQPSRPRKEGRARYELQRTVPLSSREPHHTGNLGTAPLQALLSERSDRCHLRPATVAGSIDGSWARAVEPPLCQDGDPQGTIFCRRASQ